MTSEEFDRAFSGVGSIVLDCGCGRTHYVAEGDYEDGELEELRARAESFPLKFIETDDDFVSGINVPGFGVIVRGCACGRDVAVEEFLRERKGEILDYYRRVLEKQEREGAELRTGLEALK